MLENFETYNKHYWACCKRYYRDGLEVVPWMQQYQSVGEEDEDKIERWLAFFFNKELNKPWEDFLIYSPEPRERLEGFIYEGIRVKRSPDLSLEEYQEFLDIEDSMVHNPDRKGYVREIWKYHFREIWRGIKTYTKKPDGSIIVNKLNIVTA